MFTLPKLSYSYDALEPFIDARTMEIHHTKHHQAYVDNLNKALEKYPDLQQKSLEELVREAVKNGSVIPEEIRMTVRNNAGGHFNHAMFWESMRTSGGGEPTGKLREAIDQSFQSFERFKQIMTETAVKHFGSGWAWLFLAPPKVDPSQRTLLFGSMPNQDSPLMIPDTKPIMGIDIWEHAYYLKYQNRRAEYIENWWNIVHWGEIEKRFNILP